MLKTGSRIHYWERERKFNKNILIVPIDVDILLYAGRRMCSWPIVKTPNGTYLLLSRSISKLCACFYLQ